MERQAEQSAIKLTTAQFLTDLLPQHHAFMAIPLLHSCGERWLLHKVQRYMVSPPAQLQGSGCDSFSQAPCFH